MRASAMQSFVAGGYLAAAHGATPEFNHHQTGRHHASPANSGLFGSSPAVSPTRCRSRYASCSRWPAVPFCMDITSTHSTPLVLNRCFGLLMPQHVRNAAHLGRLVEPRLIRIESN